MSTWSQPLLPPRFLDNGEPTFVGRSQELDLLEQVWDRVSSGRRQAVFITGEPGSGKSRLTSVLARALYKEGCTVLLGTAAPDLGYPYRPFVEALDQLFRGSAPGDLAAFLPESAGELTRLTSTVIRHGVEERFPDTDRQEYRRELFDAVVDLIDTLAKQAPLVLILEDLHWSTAPSRLLLSHLIQSADQMPLLVIGTFRNTAPDRSDDLSFAIADLYRLPGVERIDLTGLDASEIELYLRAESSSKESGKELAGFLRDLTGGNPFFLRELWRDISKGGGLSNLKRNDFRSPSSVKDTLEKRIRSFGSAERETIEFAAVAGDVFSPDWIVHSSALGQQEVLASLDATMEHGLIAVGPEPGFFSFQHALVRQSVLEGLSPSRSAQIHADIANYLVRRSGEQQGMAPVLARLFLGAQMLGYHEECVHYLSVAAGNAERSLAHEEAADLWLRAAGMTTDESVAERARLSAADCYVKAADFANARSIYGDMSGSHDAEVEVRAAIGFEDASWRVGMAGFRALNLLESAVARMKPNPKDPTYVRAMSSLGRAYAWSGNPNQAVQVGSRAIEMAREIGDETLICEALHASMRVVTPAHRVASYDLALELRELAIRTGNYEALSQAGAFRVITAYMSSRPSEFDDGIEDIRRSIEVTGSRFWTWVEACVSVLREFLRGEFDIALELAERAVDFGYNFGTDDTEGPYGIQMYLLHRETGRLDAMRPLITGDPTKDGSWAPGLLAIYTELGFHDSARQLLWGLLESELDDQRAEAIWPAVVAFMCEAAIEIEDEELLTRVREIAVEFTGFGLMAGSAICAFGSADRYLAQIDDLLGDTESAEQLYVRALEMDAKMQSLTHQAETMARFSQFLAKRDSKGDAELAIQYRQKALDLAKRRGHRRITRMLEPNGFDLPDGLTPREVDVLQLLATGATNREIGTELFISENTAANHVRNILIKTMASNRTQAAIYAADNGLLD